MKKNEKAIPALQNEAFIEAGQRVRKIREQKGMSQENLAFEAKIDQSGVSKVERLGPQIVSWTKLLTIADALGCVVEINFRAKG